MTLHSRQEEGHQEGATKLLAAGFIKEVYHTEWLADPVLVLKKNNN
jgi:hypothetical protein